MSIALPSAFQARMQHQLGPEYSAFETALSHEAPTSIRLNPQKGTHAHSYPPIAWHPYGYYLPERPPFTTDPWLHGGAYYVQEASSMAVGLPLQQHLSLTEPIRVLDLCGAPGGKSTLLASLLSEESLLVTNEVVKARSQVLAENMTKWGHPNVVVTHSDPQQFAQLEDFFDAIIVDAPCSGEGLFRRDDAARAEWSEEHVGLCTERQRRILSDIWPALKPGGLLIYSTCTYNHQENESNVAWIQQELGAESLPLTFPEGVQATPSTQAGVVGYHFYPHHIQGEGFFLSALHKDGDRESSFQERLKKTKLVLAKREDHALLADWLQTDQPYDGFWQGDTLMAMHANHLASIDKLAKHVYIVQAGTAVAERTKKKPNPTPSLALSTIQNPETFPSYALSYEQALRYLSREDVFNPNMPTGWVRVSYQGVNLGWIKAMPNRANNYWPMPWRIRKAYSPDDGWSLGGKH